MLPTPIREYVDSLARLLYYANSRDDGRWASQHDGVYGYAADCLWAIVREHHGEEVAKIAREKFAHDEFSARGVEWAIEQAEENIREQHVDCDV